MLPYNGIDDYGGCGSGVEVRFKGTLAVAKSLMNL
jgi:hypothetical protein